MRVGALCSRREDRNLEEGMMGVTYDKVSWHFPDGKNCPDLDAAKVHFDVLMRWLESQHLLSEEGQETMEVGIDSDFSLTSHMLTDKGNRLLTACYTEWARTVKYGVRPSMSILDHRLHHPDVA